MPIVGHIAESGMVLCDEFREGNASSCSRNLYFIRQCVEQLPSGKRIKYLRSDSAAYRGKIIDYCVDNGIELSGSDIQMAFLSDSRQGRVPCRSNLPQDKRGNV